MQFIIFITLLFLSFGLSALGIITSYRLKSNPLIAFASTLFYWSTFMTAFGFYGIWGMIFFQYLARAPELSTPFIQNLISVIPALGSPLLLVSWFLMIRFAFEFSKLQFPRLLTFIYFGLALPLLIIFLYLIKINLPTDDFDMNQLYKIVLIIHFTCYLGVSAVLIYGRSKQKNIISPSLLIMSIIAPATMFIALYFFRHSHWIIEHLFILCYFISPALVPAIIYFKIGDFEVRKESGNSFSQFCERYEISKREAEIVEQICKGKTNQEIADSLFISLQTVKDHASRIYLKTSVSNRVQLTNLVRIQLKSP
ncbi:helix-turn-helix transcriptional regulator [Mangrovibacterium lignilyticum]|uniref:helix-turn-helix transcriptional regulator n=1 Tax=Mangrovibacterium lignilyticum TaxID=2668052 RepID=UPI00196844D7|nr:helix-turn-helix transcriptional regulator [Mangrovibacterium lignilyticum]